MDGLMERQRRQVAGNPRVRNVLCHSREEVDERTNAKQGAGTMQFRDARDER